MRYHIVIPAAGNGFRYGAPVPKQYLALAGKPVLQHAIDRMASSFPLSRICVVLAPNDCWFENLIAKQGSLQALRCGGEGREESVRNAIDALIGVEDDDWIVVHDAVRPCIDLVASLRLKSELSDDPIGGLSRYRYPTRLRSPTLMAGYYAVCPGRACGAPKRPRCSDLGCCERRLKTQASSVGRTKPAQSRH
jgi:hypothetical protein